MNGHHVSAVRRRPYRTRLIGQLAFPFRGSWGPDRVTSGSVRGHEGHLIHGVTPAKAGAHPERFQWITAGPSLACLTLPADGALKRRSSLAASQDGPRPSPG